MIKIEKTVNLGDITKEEIVYMAQEALSMEEDYELYRLFQHVVKDMLAAIGKDNNPHIFFQTTRDEAFIKYTTDYGIKAYEICVLPVSVESDSKCHIKVSIFDFNIAKMITHTISWGY